MCSPELQLMMSGDGGRVEMEMETSLAPRSFSPGLKNTLLKRQHGPLNRDGEKTHNFCKDSLTRTRTPIGRCSFYYEKELLDLCHCVVV